MTYWACFYFGAYKHLEGKSTVSVVPHPEIKDFDPPSMGGFCVGIYLLDDIFSALDHNICKKIFEGVFCNYLKDKTRIMVVNKNEFLKYFDNIIVLENRKIKFHGNYNEFEQFKEFVDIRNFS